MTAEPPDCVLVSESPTPWPVPPLLSEDGTRDGPLFQFEEHISSGQVNEKEKGVTKTSSRSGERELEPPIESPPTRIETAGSISPVETSNAERRASEHRPAMEEMGEEDGPSQQPHVIQHGESKVSYAIFERVAQLYPVSLNKRALTEAEEKRAEEEIQAEQRLAEKATAKQEANLEREIEAKERMGCKDPPNLSKAVPVGTSEYISSGGSRENPPLPPFPNAAPLLPATPSNIKEQKPTVGRPLSRSTNNKSTEGNSRLKKGVALVPDDDSDDYEFELAKKERLSETVDDSESPSFDSGLMLSTPGLYRSPSRSNSTGSTKSGAYSPGSSGPVKKGDSPSVDKGEPTLVIRRPMGSRRPSFVSISETSVPSASSNAVNLTIVCLESKPSGEPCSNPGLADDDERATDSREKVHSNGNGRRGEEGNLSGRDSVRTHQEARNKPLPYESPARTSATHEDSTVSASVHPSESFSTSAGQSSDNIGDQKKGEGLDSRKNTTSPVSSPLHDIERAPSKTKPSKLRRRVAGPDTPEAARTEFTVAYSLERAMDAISHISRTDLGKVVYRRQTGTKLRVENADGSVDDHMVASVELRKVMDELTHVQIRCSKSDHGRTAFATLWMFYDDLVTQLDVLAHNAAGNVKQD